MKLFGCANASASASRWASQRTVLLRLPRGRLCKDVNADRRGAMKNPLGPPRESNREEIHPFSDRGTLLVLVHACSGADAHANNAPSERQNRQN